MINNQFVLSKPAELVDFDLLKSDRSADEAFQMAAPDAPTLQDIQKYNLARRGLTSQQHQHRRGNSIYVQPFPKLSPNLKSFTSVLTPKYLSTQGDANKAALSIGHEGDGQQGSTSAAVKEDASMVMHRRLLELQKARVQTTRRILDASATDEGFRAADSFQQKMIIRVKKRLHENHHDNSTWENYRPRTQS